MTKFKQNSEFKSYTKSEKNITVMLLNITFRHQLLFRFLHIHRVLPVFLYKHVSNCSKFSTARRFSLFLGSKAYLFFLYFSSAISRWLFRAFKPAIYFSNWIAPTLFLFFWFCFSSNAFLYLKWVCLAFYSNSFDTDILWVWKLFLLM